MRPSCRINYIFWKEGPLLFDGAHIVLTHFRESELPRLRTCNQTSG